MFVVYKFVICSNPNELANSKIVTQAQIITVSILIEQFFIYKKGKYRKELVL